MNPPAPARPLVINVALTGMVPRRSDNPHVPLTPAEIVADIRRCLAAGACVFHVHARDAHEQPTTSRDVFAEIVRGIRRAAPEAIVCVTTSGRVEPGFEARQQSLELEDELRPELASLTLGSLNFPMQASVNEPETIRRLAEAMAERGIVPELEVFDFGMLDYAHFLIQRGVLKPPFVFNLLLGSLGTLAATPLNLALLVERLPPGSFWSAAGIGRFQHGVSCLAVAMGGGVRTGLEDNLWMDAEKIEPASNEALVRRAAAAARGMGRPIATPAEARVLLGLAR